MTHKNPEAIHRSISFENAKAVLIILVVIGHIIEEAIQSYRGLNMAYIFIYFFHMPMFVVISGYLSRADKSKEYVQKNARYLLWPLYFCHAAWYILGFTKDLVTPYWVLWYLLALFFWRVLLPYVYKIPHIMTISILVALIAGYIPFIERPLSLSRVIVFFPFFLFGYLLKEKGINPLRTMRFSAAMVWVAVGLTAAYFLSAFPHIDSWLWGCYPYAETDMPCTAWYAFVFRLLHYIAGFMVGLAFLRIIPASERFWSGVGQHTFKIFIGHSFIIRPLQIAFYLIRA